MNTIDKLDIEEPYHQLDMKYADTDSGNKDRFVNRNRDKCLYVPELKTWVTWDGKKWQKSGISSIMKLADDTAKEIFLEAKECKNNEGMKRLSIWALRSQTEQRLNSMINLSSKWPEMVASIVSFDKDPDYINCQNGVLHLPSNELSAHHPSQRHMQITNVAYIPHARCPEFDQFLREIFLDDKELLSWMQKVMGYQLTGHVSEQVLFFNYGTGANGKSTLNEVILHILGDYSSTIQFETLLAGDKSATRTFEAVGKLQGKRMVVASEVDNSKRLSEALIKQLTGGDTLTGAKLYGSTYEFLPQHKINLQVNHLPYTKDASYGMERRLKVIPFKRKFSEAQRDINLPNKLREQKEGIFAWLARGAKRWYKEVNENYGQPALKSCDTVKEATHDYIEDNDRFGSFLSACTIKDPISKVLAVDLHNAYKNWSAENGETYQMGMNIFSSRLKERDYVKKRTNRSTFYLGLSLKPEATDF